MRLITFEFKYFDLLCIFNKLLQNTNNFTFFVRLKKKYNIHNNFKILENVKGFFLELKLKW